jgi:hypothetical protein
MPESDCAAWMTCFFAMLGYVSFPSRANRNRHLHQLHTHLACLIQAPYTSLHAFGHQKPLCHWSESDHSVASLPYLIALLCWQLAHAVRVHTCFSWAGLSTQPRALVPAAQDLAATLIARGPAECNSRNSSTMLTNPHPPGGPVHNHDDTGPDPARIQRTVLLVSTAHPKPEIHEQTTTTQHLGLTSLSPVTGCSTWQAAAALVAALPRTALSTRRTRLTAAPPTLGVAAGHRALRLAWGAGLDFMTCRRAAVAAS